MEVVRPPRGHFVAMSQPWSELCSTAADRCTTCVAVDGVACVARVCARHREADGGGAAAGGERHTLHRAVEFLCHYGGIPPQSFRTRWATQVDETTTGRGQ